MSLLPNRKDENHTDHPAAFAAGIHFNLWIQFKSSLSETLHAEGIAAALPGFIND